MINTVLRKSRLCDGIVCASKTFDFEELIGVTKFLITRVLEQRALARDRRDS